MSYLGDNDIIMLLLLLMVMVMVKVIGDDDDNDDDDAHMCWRTYVLLGHNDGLMK